MARFFSAKYSLNKQTLTVVRGFSENWHVKNGIYLGNKVTSPSVLLRDVAPPLCALLRRATWALNWHSELFEISTVVQHSTPRSSNFGWQSFQNLWQLSWMIIDCFHLLFPLMLRKHSGAALSLHLFSNLRSPTGLKCRAVTGGLDSSDRFFCTQLPSRNWVLLAFAIVLFHHIPSNVCPKWLARITILCGKTFL